MGRGETFRARQRLAVAGPMAELRAIKLGPELLEGDLIWRRRTRAKTGEAVARGSLGPEKQGALAWRCSPRERPSNTTREGPPSTGRTHFRNLQGPPLRRGAGSYRAGFAWADLWSPGDASDRLGNEPLRELGVLDSARAALTQAWLVSGGGADLGLPA